MKAVVQRTTGSSVEIDGSCVGRIEHGLTVLLGVEPDDTASDVDYIVKKCVNLRIFEDEQGKMNRSVTECGGGILLISQFTLLGDARKGNRPSFIGAARPETALPLYEKVIEGLREYVHVETGVFGADMRVSILNDGPVTILLDSRKAY